LFATAWAFSALLKADSDKSKVSQELLLRVRESREIAEAVGTEVDYPSPDTNLLEYFID